ncbi:MAG TPA: patatin-like phospholipase family protein, partial [Pseudolabrys sp.]
MTRPTIGLALGGGAARGFAHIGVMRVLAAHGIVPDVIVGTSIGAVVGGCYAAQQLDALEDWARSLNIRSVMSYLDINLSGSGLITGNHLAKMLEAGLHDTRIDELSTRFAAIATEFNTGHEIWLTRGRLVEAMRASYALPGIFPPVRIGGRWLVDGALVNPVPVSAARALGARLVIAVNLNSDLFGRGTIIASHGSDEDDLAEAAAAALPKAAGLRSLFGREPSLR